MSEPLGAGYLLEERIGQGGTGEVWRGLRRSDGRPFAFKLLRPQLLSDRSFVAGFLQERVILTEIAPHPNLVHVHDLVVEGEQFAIVMDLVKGPDLRKGLTVRRTLPAGEALSLVAGVLNGVAALHAAGVVHRDLKPENVLLDTTNGVVPRITDYGTAKMVAEVASTRTSSVIGTPDYMAPELADQGEITGGADVYSAGVLLYELLCGVTPFAGGPPVAVLRRHLDKQPGRPDHIDDNVWDLLSQMLAKQPGQRPLALSAAAQCSDLSGALANVPALPKLTMPPPPLDDAKLTQDIPRPQAPPEPTTKPLRKRLILAAAAAGVAIVTIGGIALARSGNESPSAVTPPTTSLASPASSSVTASPTPSPTSSTVSTSPTATPTPATMPDLTSMTVDQAQQELSSLGVTPKISYDLSESAEDGDVLTQMPKAGEPFSRVVELKVARFVLGSFLSDQEPVDESSDDTGTDVTSMNGREYPNSVYLGDSDNYWYGGGDYDPVFIEYDVGRHYQVLKATVGLSSQSHSDSKVRLRILKDNRPAFDSTFKVGRVKHIKIDVDNVLRLRFEITTTQRYSTSEVLLGNAKVLGYPQDVPQAPEPSPSET